MLCDGFYLPPASCAEFRTRLSLQQLSGALCFTKTLLGQVHIHPAWESARLRPQFCLMRCSLHVLSQRLVCSPLFTDSQGILVLSVHVAIKIGQFHSENRAPLNHLNPTIDGKFLHTFTIQMAFSLDIHIFGAGWRLSL